PAEISRQCQVFSLVRSSNPRKRVSMALLKNSAVRTRPMHKRSRHHCSTSHFRMRAAARTRALKKKWTKKLLCPRIPNLRPRRAFPNLACQGRLGQAAGSGSGFSDRAGNSGEKDMRTSAKNATPGIFLPGKLTGIQAGV